MEATTAKTLEARRGGSGGTSALHPRCSSLEVVRGLLVSSGNVQVSAGLTVGGDTIVHNLTVLGTATGIGSRTTREPIEMVNTELDASDMSTTVRAIKGAFAYTITLPPLSPDIDGKPIRVIHTNGGSVNDISIAPASQTTRFWGAIIDGSNGFARIAGSNVVQFKNASDGGDFLEFCADSTSDSWFISGCAITDAVQSQSPPS